MPACDLVPMEYNVVVEMDPAESITKGGIIIPLPVQEAEKLRAEEGTLVAVSPLAFNFDDWPENAYRLPQVGDRVLIARFAGVTREKDGTTWRIVKDKEIIAVIVEPEFAEVEIPAAA